MRRRKRRKLKPIPIIILLLIVILIIIAIFMLIKPDKLETNNETKMISITSLEEAKQFAQENNLNLDVSYKYSDEVAKDKIISQSIKVNEIIKENQDLSIVVSLGKLDKEQLKKDNINELGTVPIMMYHGIINTDTTNYIGGNVDKDGYNRTSNAFREDLEFYYENNYQMIRLEDYINGKIDVDYKKSPIILTFDDGNANNIKVEGLDEDGNIIIDKNSAVGILEEFKSKHPDFNVTATFFLNSTLFNQPEYDEKIMNWLIDNGYDIGNHTQNHLDIKQSSATEVQKEIVTVYEQLDQIIPEKYVNIIALPFGSPYSKDHSNYKYVLNSTYNNKTYKTTAALRVGWEPELSPFHKDFDKTFLKRVRAYDNNGEEFDIEMVFNMLETRRYISDGNIDTIVTSQDNNSLVADTNLEVIYY